MTCTDINFDPCAAPAYTDKLTASRKLDCGELLFIVFLEGWTELTNECRGLHCQSLDIYPRRLSTVRIMVEMGVYLL